MVFRTSHGIGCWSQLRLTSLGAQRHKLAPANLERVAGSIGIVLGRLTVGNGWTGVSVPLLCRRTYANTPVSRPKAHTGRTTSAPRKKAATRTVRKATAQPTRKKAPQAKRRSRPAVKSRRKVGRPRKRTRAKPQAKRPGRRPLSEKSKLRLAKQKNAATVRRLRERALSAPPSTRRGRNAWFAFLAEQRSALRQAGDPAADENVTEFSKTMRPRYQALSPAQLEHYNHVANQKHSKEIVDYHKWLESHTPMQIREANIARRALGRRGLKPSTPLKDERQVTGITTSYLWFVKDRRASGDYKGISPRETVKLIASEWKAAGPTEKKKFQDLHAQDSDRYRREYKTVHGVDPTSVKRQRSTNPTASRAAATRTTAATSAATTAAAAAAGGSR